MNIKEFVKDALTQIAEGVNEANNTLIPLGAQANPPKSRRVVSLTPGQAPHQQQNNVPHTVYFDLAVTVQVASESGGNGGVNIYAVQFQGGGKKSHETSNVSRLRFEIPLLLPPPPKKEQA